MARRTAWEDTLVNLNVGNAAQNSTQMMVSTTADELRGSTLTRVIVDLGLYSVTTAGAWGVQLVDLALATLEEDAFIAGVLPDPNVSIDEPPRGWVFRTRCVVTQNGVGTSVSLRCFADLRAQRKMQGSILALIANNNNDVGATFTIRASGIVRTLLLLP